MIPRTLLCRALLYSSLGLILAGSRDAVAQQLNFTPHHPDGIYEVNEKVGWTATLKKDSAPPSGTYSYAIKKNNFGNPIKAGTLDLSSGSAAIEVTIDEPAMLYVQVTPPAGGGRAVALGAAVSPAKLKPTDRP